MKKSIFLLIFISLFSINLFAEDSIKWSGDLKAKWKSIGNKAHMNLECSALGYYENENTWVDAKFKACHDDACNSSPSTKIVLDRCLVGYEFVHPLAPIFSREFIEIGRDKLDSMFESKLQYNSYFNGLHLSFERGALQMHGGPHIINSASKHYGMVVEIIYSGLPVTLTHSITNWAPYHDYTITQTTAKYKVAHVNMRPVVAYMAVLRNLRCRGNNNGAYIGATLGGIKGKGDLLFDANFQYTSVDAIPQFDHSGIGIGAGLQLKGAYAITDRFSVQGKFGISHNFLSEISAIYQW